MFGSYQRIEGGIAGEAMRWLTGCPQFRYILTGLDDSDGLWYRLEDAVERNFPICCCTYSKPDVMPEPTPTPTGTPTPGEETVVEVIDHEKHGLDNNASYTVIGAKTIELDDCSEDDLL